MLKTIKQLAIGASMLAGVSAIATAPAFAANFTPSTSGGATYLLYDANSSSTFVNSSANLDDILAGNSISPGGNIELFANSETSGGTTLFSAGARASITGTVAGQSLTLSSLTAEDWFKTDTGVINTNYGFDNNGVAIKNLANDWFNAFLNAAGQGGASSTLKTSAFNTFKTIGGFQRTSDPNISYVTASGSDILIGLAGHYDLKAFYGSNSQYAMFTSLLPNGFQASEVVKASINGATQYLYSFDATRSNLTNSAGVGADGTSHSGNYEVALRDVIPPPPPADVPEPSIIFGLMAVGGAMATKRRLQKV